MRVLLFKPLFHFARLGLRQLLSCKQKLPIRTKGCLAARVVVEIPYHVKLLFLVTWLATRQLLIYTLWTLITKHRT